MKTKIFQLLNNEIELDTNETGLSKLYVNSDTKTIRYITTSLDGDNHQYYESDIHLSELTDKQRHEILNYCLSSFDAEEVVNFTDLFMHHKYISKLSLPQDYTLTDEWYMSEPNNLKGVRDAMLERGEMPNEEGAVYLAEGVWIMPDGSLESE